MRYCTDPVDAPHPDPPVHSVTTRDEACPSSPRLLPQRQEAPAPPSPPGFLLYLHSHRLHQDSILPTLPQLTPIHMLNAAASIFHFHSPPPTSPCPIMHMPDPPDHRYAGPALCSLEARQQASSRPSRSHPRPLHVVLLH